jgi:hypothetical protein
LVKKLSAGAEVVDPNLPLANHVYVLCLTGEKAILADPTTVVVPASLTKIESVGAMLLRLKFLNSVDPLYGTLLKITAFSFLENTSTDGAP